MQSKTRTAVEKSPRALLVCLFLAWKVLLLTIALLGPGADYDTSTQLLLRGYGVDQTVDASSPLFEAGLRSNVSQTAQHVVNSLTRWDAIYFASTAERGYVFEQEWAFGWGFSRLLSLLSRCTCSASIEKQLETRTCPLRPLPHSTHLSHVVMGRKATTDLRSRHSRDLK